MVNKVNVVAVDFDGTCVTDEFPGIGKKIGAGPVLRLLQSKGIKIILNTVRDGFYALDAGNWLQREEGIKLFGINLNPEQRAWSKSPKVHADIFIDDRSIGVPLVNDDFVDWERVLEEFIERGFIVCTLEEVEGCIEEIRKELYGE